MGFPIAEVSESGELLLTKPPGTGGIISVGTVAEQMLYEIGDPRAYQLPDVVADWSNVQMLEVRLTVSFRSAVLTVQVAGGVRVKGARGRPPSNHYKISATYMDGYKVKACSPVPSFPAKLLGAAAGHLCSGVPGRSRRQKGARNLGLDPGTQQNRVCQPRPAGLPSDTRAGDQAQLWDGGTRDV